MNDWSVGYVTEIDYTHGYYNELNPLNSRLAFLNQGLMTPEFGAACELGFGQGVSVNIHAAASQIAWYGTDFNPAQAVFAQDVANASGSEARLYDDAFSEFSSRADLPDFDYIGLHGIWSWISDENRSVIVDFIRRKLKVGGVLYISYNTLPGWGAFVPMRRLLTEHVRVLGQPGQGIIQKINDALDFSERLLNTNPIYSQANPRIKERLNQIHGQNRNYLVHEFFNRDWKPMQFVEMLPWLESAKLQYAGSAHLLDHIDTVNLTADQQALLQAIPDAMFRETVRDFMTNQHFRRDYWVKGARRLSAMEQAEAIRNLRIVLISHRSGIIMKTKGALGEANLTAAIYNPILDLLADHRPRTMGQIEQKLSAHGIGLGQIMQAVMVLAGSGHLTIAQPDEITNKVRKQTMRLNQWLCQKARSSNDIGFLASPVTGGGIAVSRFQQLFLLSLAQGKQQPTDWAQATWPILAAQNQKLIKEGQILETSDENIAELQAQARLFAEQTLPMLKAVQII